VKTKLKVLAIALMTGPALGCVTGLLLSCTRPRPSALKPIDQAALQTMVARTARELLAQENKLSLDDPVSKYVPGVPDGDNITIAELLNMRSGLLHLRRPP
jgi:beta-lactamase family protein